MILTALATVALTQTAAPVKIEFVKAVPGLKPLAFAPAPTGANVAMTLEDSSVRIFNAATRVTSKTLTGHPQPAYAIDWSADGGCIAAGDVFFATS